VKRERAQELVRDLVRRSLEDPNLSWVESLAVFGSFARGALDPHDVDVIFESRRDERTDARRDEQMRTRGLSWLSGVDKRELRGHRRGLQLLHPHEAPPDADAVEIWRRGESLATAEARIRAIAPDPRAGRAERESHPALEGLEHAVGGAARFLVPLAEAGAVSMRQVVLEDRVPQDEYARRAIGHRYSERSPRRRAAAAAVAYLEAQGVPAGQISLAGKAGLWSGEPWGMSARARARELAAYVTLEWSDRLRWMLETALGDEGVYGWLWLPRVPAKAELRALEVRPAAVGRLATTFAAIDQRNEELLKRRAAEIKCNRQKA
jgi:predicted nucleotidyltransferase